MHYTKEKAIAVVSGRAMLKFLAFTSLLMILPFLIHIQWITGPIVNAILILIIFLVGKKEAIMACFIPSLMALAGGLLPLALAPVIPFIMMGNLLYVLLLYTIYEKNTDTAKGYWLGLTIGATAKFIFILISAMILANFFIPGKFGLFFAQMMSWTQFATSFLGGMIAWMVLKWLRRI